MRLLVVDDEAPITAYIVHCIKQAGAAYTVVASASRGEAALKIMASERIDVVLTDITMPKMDGLELLAQIKRAWPEVFVVMLTCHNDFEYARSAIQRGATDYILKSEMTPESMRGLLTKLEQKFQTHAEKDFLGNITRIRDLNIALTDDRVDLLSGDLLEILPGMGLDYFAIVFKYNKSAMDNLAMNRRQWMIEPMVFSMEHNRISVISGLLPILDEEIKLENITELQNELQKLCHTRVGTSRIYHSPVYLKRAILEAVADTDREFYHRLDQISKKPIQADMGQTFICIRNNAIAAVSDHNMFAFRQHMDQLFAYAKEGNSITAARLKRTLLTIVRSVADHDLQQYVPAMENAIHDANYLIDLEGVFDQFIRNLESGKRRYSASIGEAVSYISLHFREDITLQDVAQAVFLSGGYLSRRFKKEVGANFSDYLLKLRLDEAMQLLQSTNLRVGEVSGQVGIGNISYFSNVFRKQFGISPNELRKK